MFAAVLKPARSLMGPLKYLEKFLLISVLFVVPLATVMYAYITDANAQIDFANSELSGTRYLRPLNALFADVLHARGASERGAAAELAAAQKAITTDLAAVADVEGQLGASLKTTTQFGALKNDVTALSSPQADDDAYTAVVADIQALVAQVGDGSSLILDPALDSYYLMDIVIIELPNVQDLSGQIRALAAGLARRPAITADERADLRVLAVATRARLEAIKRGTTVAFGNTQDAALQSDLDTATQDAVARTEAVLKSIDASVGSSDALGKAAGAVDAAAGAAIDAQFVLEARTTTALDRIMTGRADDYTNRRNRVEIVAGVALAVVLYLFAGFYISVVAAASAIAQSARQLAEQDMPEFVERMRALSTGDLTQEVTFSVQRLNVPKRDELGRIAGDFNRLIDGLRETGVAFGAMNQKLRELVGQVQASALGLNETSAQLSAASTQTGSVVQQVTLAVQNVALGAQDSSRGAQETNDAISQLARAIDGIARGASEQARQVQVVSGSAAQMAAGVEQVAANARTVADASEQTRAAAEHGRQAVRETTAAMAEIQMVVGQAAVKVRNLGGLGERIGAVVETIDDIAEQTNLLALNAAIEAARAGEHGKGFAVVADEVRKLAERSSRETKQIAALIAQVQAGTKDAVSAMETGSVRIEHGSQMAIQAGLTLDEILAAAETSVRQVTEIATSSQHMAAGAHGVTEGMLSISAVVEQNNAATEDMAAQAGHVTDAIQSIAAVSEEQSAATEQVMASAQEMGAQVEELNAQAQGLAATARELKSLVTRFIVDDRATGAAPAPPLRRAA
jgi:methyl-accepting chemotaxis protein